MIIYPAIDIMNGRCVRLYKGNFTKCTKYQISPINVSKKFKQDGSKWLHIVDLDGAKNPEERQLNLIKKIIKESGLKVQTGGGIRSFEDIEKLIYIGTERIIIGSLSVKNPNLTRKIIKHFGPDRICLAADVLKDRNKYKIAVSGWQERSEINIYDFLSQYHQLGIKHILCTDVSKDGTMLGCNISLYDNLIKAFPELYFQASGGISNLDDLKNLSTNGAVIGKALYDGAFTLRNALDVTSC